ncbi:MAG: hypothetical protein V4739_04695 [Pseudomonadota bacterium]
MRALNLKTLLPRRDRLISNGLLVASAALVLGIAAAVYFNL